MKKNKMKGIFRKNGIFATVAIIAVLSVAVVAAVSRNRLPADISGNGAIETHKGSLSVNSDKAETTGRSETTDKETDPETEPPETLPPETLPPETLPPETLPPETLPPETLPPETIPPETIPPVTTPPVTGVADTTPPIPQKPFDSALFIGDSRTIGLSEYANLGEATVFASKGMNVFRALKDSLNISEFGDVTLEGLLSEKQFSKIYIMLGINEIGYPPSSVIKKYTEIVNLVKSAQPDATIYIQANLHITAKRSEIDTVYNNAKLNDLNRKMAELADGAKVVYIDANHIFDDEKGALAEEYAADDFHLVGRYYSVWADWIAANTN